MIHQDTDENRQIVVGLMVFALLGLMVMGLPGLLQSLIHFICRICYELERFLMYRFCPDLFETVNYVAHELIPSAAVWH